MKISNETKIGALTAISITLLILGFNMLKGKSLFSRNTTLFAIYDKVNGLQASNSVLVNGLVVGNVSSLDVMDEAVGHILVKLTIKRKIRIPKNSVAHIISADLLGTKAIRIEYGNAGDYLHDNDTIATAVDGALTDIVMKQLMPVTAKVQGTLAQLDAVLMSIRNILEEPGTKNHLRATLANLHTTTDHLSQVSEKTEVLVDNLNNITGNLKKNNEHITQILSNTEKATGVLADGKLENIIQHIQETASQLNDVMTKLNKTDGSLGLLLNDKKLYNNLEVASQSLNLLLQDLHRNPQRYVHFSLFGRKNKIQPLKDTLQ